MAWWYEIDMNWYGIWMLKKLGLARHVYKIELDHLPPKPPLVRDVEAAAVLVAAAGNDLEPDTWHPPRYNLPVRIISRQKAIYFFLTFGVLLAAVAFAVGSGWIILNWREGIKVFLGIIFFGAIVAGLVLNTIFLVREIRRNEQHDSFINAVTHELKTPIASIRLYLQTLQRRDVDEAQRRQFYALMLLDTERLLHTVEQVLKAGEAAQKKTAAQRSPVEFNTLVRECMELAQTRHHLPAASLDYIESCLSIFNTKWQRSPGARRSRRIAHCGIQSPRQRRQVFPRWSAHFSGT
jgi:signal transduction histidine kinase